MEENIFKASQLKEFEKYLQNEEKSRATVEKYLRDVKKWMVFLDNRPAQKALMIEYKEYLSTHYVISSANSMIASVNAFLKYCCCKELCIKQFRIQKKVYCSEENELTKKEYIRLVEAAFEKGNERLGLILQTICGTGIRISELKYITAESVKKGIVEVRCKGKNRTIFLVSKLRKKLIKYMKKQNIQEGQVFVTKSGKSMDRSNIWREMKTICKDAGVSEKKVFPHNLRHLFARTFYEMEKDIAKLADLLGHSSINTTRLYIITTGEEHRRKIERMQLII